MKLGPCFAALTLLYFACLECAQPATATLSLQSCCDLVDQCQQCHAACIQVSSPCLPNVENKTHYLMDFCPEIPQSLISCFDNVTSNITTQPTPSPELLDCCNQSPSQNCRDVCIEQITLGVFDDAAVLAVVDACGVFNPLDSSDNDPIWNCFFIFADGQQQQSRQDGNQDNSSCTTPPPQVIQFADWPRLHCCSKANDSLCADACLYEYTGRRTATSWETLNRNCTFRATEGRLTSCLNDVTTRCSTGCSGLNYCSNFNNRPLTSFRKCTQDADLDAKRDYTSWLETNTIVHPLVTVSVRPLSTCYPELWKMVACSFQLMPCQASSDTSLICKEDCLFLVNACKSSVTQSAEEVCELLSPGYLQRDCISLQSYLIGSNYTETEIVSSELTTPCSSSPCTNDRKCVVNHACSGNHGDSNCPLYYCVEASELGQNPKMALEKLSLVHVLSSPFDECHSCYGYVNCTPDNNGGCVFGSRAGNVTHQYCIQHDACIYKGQNYSHNEVFSDNCNVCRCQSGRVNCTCSSCYDSSSAERHCAPPYCFCPTFYDPVCTSNGLTLPNIAFANCYGYTNKKRVGQSCSDGNDPCSSAQCSPGSKCIPHRHVCVSSNASAVVDCPQYRCVNSDDCNEYQRRVVCDQNGVEHSSMCSFINIEEPVDYYGYCQVECSHDRRRAVCGVNGETYPSSCHAKGMGVAVDYIAECNGVQSASAGGHCESIKCPGLPYLTDSEQCSGPIPPGACCRQCGSMVHILIDQHRLSRNSDAMGVVSIDSTQIIERLKSYVDILQCQVYGHQSFDSGSLIVLLLPANASSIINVEGCKAEATRLATLINRGSPLLVSDPYLSFLVAANHTHSTKIKSPLINTQEPNQDGVNNGCGMASPSHFLYIMLTAVVLLLTFTSQR